MKNHLLPILTVYIAFISCNRLNKEKLSNRNDTLNYLSQVLNDSIKVSFKPNQVFDYQISYEKNQLGKKLSSEQSYLSAEQLKSSRELNAIGNKYGFGSKEYEIKKIEYETIEQLVEINKREIATSNIYTMLINIVNVKIKSEDNFYYNLNFNKDLELTFIYKSSNNPF
jgi:hypothetical protein